jgi:hypothetical protein
LICKEKQEKNRKKKLRAFAFAFVFAIFCSAYLGPLLWGLFYVTVELICRRAHQEPLLMDRVMLGEFEFDLVKARLIDLLSEF